MPAALLDQLKPGGRLVLPLGPLWAGQDLVLIRRDVHGHYTQRDVLPVSFVPFTTDRPA